MRCEKVRARLEEWLDGELPANEGAELERHLRECAACARVLEQRRRLGQALKQTLREQTAGLNFQVPEPSRLAAAARAPKPLFGDRFPARLLLALAAALLLALIFLFGPWAGQRHGNGAGPALTGVITVSDSLESADETFISGRSDGSGYVIHLQVSQVRANDAL
jgi:anti-sigma factor RsiW